MTRRLSSGASALQGGNSAFGAASASGTLHFLHADMDSWVQEECVPLPVVGGDGRQGSDHEMGDSEGTQWGEEVPEGVRPELNRVHDEPESDGRV